MSFDQEYFCPHCGAILNEQPGFDPDNGTWTCTECGQMLMDDDVYDDDTYEGVAWFCDNCGVLLNRQHGFSDIYGSWICTECGHVNGTTSEDIINGFKCPRCGATLDVQSCFSKYDDDWECTECGAHLHHDYSNEEYTVLEDSDEDDIDDDDSDDDDSDEDEDSGETEEPEEEYHEYSTSDYSYTAEKNNRSSSNNTTYRTYQAPPRTASTSYSVPKSEKKKSNRLGLIILLLLLAGAIGYMVRGYFSNIEETANHPGEIKLTYSASSYEDENYYNAVIKVKMQGISDIRLTPLNDLKGGLFSGDGKKEGKIETIEINGLSDFQSGTWVDESSVVSITYHTFAKTEKNGFEISKNKHLIMNGTDISLPPYLVEDAQEDIGATYHVKGEDETHLTILFDSKDGWSEWNRYDTHYVLKKEKQRFSGISGEEIIALGKMNATVYLIQTATLAMESDSQYLHISMVSPDTSRTDYTTDYEAILSNIYVPKDSEIRIDFISRDYKGDNFNDVVAALESKGFQNIKVENLQDVVFGIFTKNGSVESVSINGNVDYKVGEWVDKQSEVVITYHGKK